MELTPSWHRQVSLCFLFEFYSLELFQRYQSDFTVAEVSMNCRRILFHFVLVCNLVFSSCYMSKNQQPGICLSFDDRTIEAWYEMRSLLNRYDAKVTFFISEFDSLSEKEIQWLNELAADGHEIGSHGAMHVNAEYYIPES